MYEETGKGTRGRGHEAAGGRRMKRGRTQRIAAKGRAGLRAGGGLPGLVPVEVCRHSPGRGQEPRKVSPSVKKGKERTSLRWKHNTHIASSAY